MQFQWLDLIFIGIIGLSSITGLFRGFIKEFIALGIWIAGIWAGYNYSQSLNPWIQPYIQDQSIRTIISFVIILLGVLIGGGILNALLGLFLKGSGLGAMDKVLGACFGFARGVFILSLILSILSMTSLPYQQYLNGSRVYPQLVPVINWISGYIPKLMNQIKTTNSAPLNLIDIALDS